MINRNFSNRLLPQTLLLSFGALRYSCTMPNALQAEIYFIAAMFILIIVISGAATYFFFRTYKKEQMEKLKRIEQKKPDSQK